MEDLINSDIIYKDPQKWIGTLMGCIPVYGKPLSFVSNYLINFILPSPCSPDGANMECGSGNNGSSGIKLCDFLLEEIENSGSIEIMEKAQQFLKLNSLCLNSKDLFSINRTTEHLNTLVCNNNDTIDCGIQLVEMCINSKLYYPLIISSFTLFTTILETINNGALWKYDDATLVQLRTNLFERAKKVTEKSVVYTKSVLLHYNSTLRSMEGSLFFFRSDYCTVGSFLDPPDKRTILDIIYENQGTLPFTFDKKKCHYIVSPIVFGFQENSYLQSNQYNNNKNMKQQNSNNNNNYSFFTVNFDKKLIGSTWQFRCLSFENCISDIKFMNAKTLEQIAHFEKVENWDPQCKGTINQYYMYEFDKIPLKSNDPIIIKFKNITTGSFEFIIE
ncbi:hypothetical protein CYY_002556 [Polysphondylium violaceum]|uniref:Uncharacterized protein n=1 Tax=Polysphondylium violaceum TaxID=133409 RepID=A0A8J4Q1H0_9MYCE|nr:hypothetical protein CYY_002556 [Polysphondylium violaceum]